ncbi:hypothetical protein D3C74_303680 [compost metagenome]
MVKFKRVSSPKTIMVGLVPELGRDKVKYLIRSELNDLYSVYVSFDNGYSGRLMPRVSTDTEESCYHDSVRGAMDWIRELEEK